MELDEKFFGWADYLVFSTTLLVSVLVGVYHAWKGANQSTGDYLLGGRQMTMLPIALSLTARSALHSCYAKLERKISNSCQCLDTDVVYCFNVLHFTVRYQPRPY